MSQQHVQPHLIDDHEDPAGLATWAIGLGGAFLMITTVAIACGIYYYAVTVESFDKSVNIRYEERDIFRSQQQALLAEPAHWVREQDATSGNTTERLVIPIDAAIDIIAGNTN